MRYGLIRNGICISIIECNNLQDAQEFISNMSDIQEVAEMPSGYYIEDFYNQGRWSKYPIKKLYDVKRDKVIESKEQLAEFLQNNPLLYNGEYYSVTQEKQALLTSAIAAYQLKVQANVPAVLKWNTTGEICREFTLEEITGLVVAITEYVQPRVERQQTYEVQINNATTIEELDSIEIDYEVV